MSNPFLPQGVKDALDKMPVSHGKRHPGLQMDRYCKVPADEGGKDKGTIKKRYLAEIAGCKGDQPYLDELNARKGQMHVALHAEPFAAVTDSDLVLHLSRAGVLDNASFCLHPIYGFAYLPGSGLKGLARAWAETAWLPGETDRDQAEKTILKVFGKSPDDARSKALNGGKLGAVGAVVFHDAWPRTWPDLKVDIVNSHHREYYASQKAPGDWEDPVPVNFLCVSRSVCFEFAVSPANGESEDSAKMAREWLKAALVHYGAGGKTNVGYGYFKMDEAPALPAKMAEAYFKTTLTLETPAFLAGANQKADDCDLRPATLRGLLRWWWRTLHAGHLDTGQLFELESALWGSAQQGGAIRLKVMSETDFKPRLNPLKRWDEDKLKVHSKKLREMGLADIKPRNVTVQPLVYSSLGMADIVKDEDGNRVFKIRYLMDPGARWTIVLSARTGWRQKVAGKKSVSESWFGETEAIEQAKAALALLCRFGGVGAKSRNGYGGISQSSGSMELAEAMGVAKSFREAHKMSGRPSNDVSIIDPKGVVSIQTQVGDPWQALNVAAGAYASFTGRRAHDPLKALLGLPRQIDGPKNDPIGHQRNRTEPHLTPRKLDVCGLVGDDARWASPVHISVRKSATGFLISALLFGTAGPKDLSVDQVDQLPGRRPLPTDPTASANFWDAFFLEFSEEVNKLAESQLQLKPYGAVGKRDAGVAVALKILKVQADGNYDVEEPDGKKGQLVNPGNRITAPKVGQSDILAFLTDDQESSRRYQLTRPPLPGLGQARVRQGGGNRGPRR